MASCGKCQKATEDYNDICECEQCCGYVLRTCPCYFQTLDSSGGQICFHKACLDEQPVASMSDMLTDILNPKITEIKPASGIKDSPGDYCEVVHVIPGGGESDLSGGGSNLVTRPPGVTLPGMPPRSGRAFIKYQIKRQLQDQKFESKKSKHYRKKLGANLPYRKHGYFTRSKRGNKIRVPLSAVQNKNDQGDVSGNKSEVDGNLNSNTEGLDATEATGNIDPTKGNEQASTHPRCTKCKSSNHSTYDHEVKVLIKYFCYFFIQKNFILESEINHSQPAHSPQPFSPLNRHFRRREKNKKRLPRLQRARIHLRHVFL